jgi:hypothetical protein
MSNPKLDEYRKLVDKIPDFDKKITEFAEQLGQTDKQPQEHDPKAPQVIAKPGNSSIMKASALAMMGSIFSNTPISKTPPMILANDSIVDPPNPYLLQTPQAIGTM